MERREEDSSASNFLAPAASFEGQLSAQQSSQIFYDEEDLLGYKIWVAELELLISQRSIGGGQARTKTGTSRAVEFSPYYMLLQKLDATVLSTSIAEVKEYQRRCEDALIDILLSGAPPPVRRLICGILSKMYAVGDSLPLYSRVSSLQLFLGTKEAFESRKTSEDIRLGALELMTTLYYSHGKALTVGVLETSSIAVKYCGKACSSATRKAGLKLLAATVEGVGDVHREATQVQIGALKCIERIVAKERYTLDATIKLGIADVLRSIAAVVPLESWLEGTLSVESVRSMCLLGVRDEAPNNGAVRYAFARALGELVARIHTGGGSTEEAGSRSMAGPEGADERPGETSKKYKPGVMSENVELSLTAPMAEALMAEDRQACIALSQAWVAFLTRFKMYSEQKSGCFDAQELVELSKGPLVAVRVASVTSSGNMLAERGVGQSVDVGLGASVCTGDRPFSQACVTYILRCGIVEQMGEHGQQELLLSLSRALVNGFNEFTPSLIMAQLNIISHLIRMLGEIGDERAEAVEQALALCFASQSAAVRQHAGSALSALAIAESGRAARLFASSLSALKNAADALVDASNGVPDKGKAQNLGIPRWAGTAKFGKEIDAIHGWALATACLVSVTPSLPLGIPSHYLRVACQIAAALIESPRCEHPGGRCVELEAGYVILGALCEHTSGILMSVYEDSLLKMWLPMFSEGSLNLLSKVAGSRDEQALAAELWWRSESLHALGAYARHSAQHMPDDERMALSNFLSSAFKAVAENATVLRPTDVVSRGGYTQLQGAAALFQIRLLRMMCSMSLQLWSDKDLVSALSDVCFEGLAGSAMGLASVAGAESFLSSILNLEEDLMRRVYSSKDIFERNLLQFHGASGGIERELWSLRADISSQTVVGDSSSRTYPQPLSLSDGLFLARSKFLARVLQAGDADQANAIVARLCGLPADVKKDKTGVKKIALGIAASCPLILATHAGTKCGLEKLTAESVARMEGLAEELSVNSSQGLWVQATVAELYAGISRAVNDQQSHHLLSTLCGKSVSTASLDQRASCVLSIGSMSRGIGGLGLASLLPQIVQTLIALGRASPSTIAPFVADALSAASTSSGPSFLPFVRETLDLVQEMLLDDEIYSTPGLLPSIGQLGNAMVACLGPDYILGSAAYDICRSIVSELRAPDPCGVRLKEDILAGALQSVLYAQMLVLFVPKALTTAQHVKVLVDTLPSRQPYLRRAAADTLRHLSERETDKVLSLGIEGSLLMALDGETDRGAAEQLKAAIKVLLVHGAPSKPCSWIKLLGAVATGTVFSHMTGNIGRPMAVLPGRYENGDHGDHGDDHEDDPTGANGMAGGTMGAVSDKVIDRRRTPSSNMSVSPRLRTRVFAASCLIMVPSLAIKADKVHADAVMAGSRPGEWLALSAESLVDIGFKLASGDADGLRSRGVKLLSETLDALGASKDPLDHEELLMVQYQAQYVSALRGSLSKGASPAVNAEGCELVALFLEKGMAASDKQLLERLLSLLCEPLSSWSSGSPDPTQNAYAEWVAAGARAALLESHALCATLDVKSQSLSMSPAAHGIPYDEIVSRAHGPFYTILVECWTGLLEDAIVLLRGDQTQYGQHTLRLYGRLGAAKAPTLAIAKQGISRLIHVAWPTILDACTLVMSRDRTVSHGDSGRSRYLSLFDITVSVVDVTHLMKRTESGSEPSSAHDVKCMVAVMRSLSRLTEARYAKEGWLERDMVQQAAEIALNVMQESKSVDVLELGALVIQNAMECTALKHEPGEVESRLAWTLKCIQIASHASPTCLETALGTMRQVLMILITNAAAVEETSYCLFHAMKCSFDLCRASSSSSPLSPSTSPDISERTMVLAYSHVVETARIVASYPDLAATTLIDPSIPSVEDTLTSTASEACSCLLRNQEAEQYTSMSAEYLAKVILEVGAMSSAPCQAACIETLDTCLQIPSLQQQVIQAIESWLDDRPEHQWMHQCGRAIFPNVVRELYACSIPSDSPTTSQGHRADTVTSMVRICASFCEMIECSDVYLRSGLPVIVRLASQDIGNNVRSACVNAMLSLARGPASTAFKSIIKELPENERVKLHEVLASGGPHPPAHARTSSTSGTAKGGLQALDLSRFTQPK